MTTCAHPNRNMVTPPPPPNCGTAAASVVKPRIVEKCILTRRGTKVLYSTVSFLGYRGRRDRRREAHFLYTAIDFACLYKDGWALARLPVADMSLRLLCCDRVPNHLCLAAMLYHLGCLMTIAGPKRHLPDRL